MSKPLKQRDEVNPRILQLVKDAPKPVRQATSLDETFALSPILFEKTSDVSALGDPTRVALSGIGLSWAKYNQETKQLEHGLTSGLPIDIMSYLSVIGQRHKYEPEAPKTIFLVSDYFAQGLPGISADNLEEATKAQIERLTNLAGQLKIQGTNKTLLDCLDIRRVSKDVTENKACFDQHYNNLAHHDNDYERRQTAAIAMYREITGASVKISYAFEDAANPSGKKDERSFDTLSGDYEPTEAMSFVYVDIGRSTETSAAKACPYITTESLKQSRLMAGDSDFLEKINDCAQKVEGKTGRSRQRDRKRLEGIKTYYLGLADLADSTFTVVDEAKLVVTPNITGRFDHGINNLQTIGLLTQDRT